MRKTTLVTLAVLLLVAAIAAVVVLRPFSSDTGLLRDLSTRFIEDLQFKDFRSSKLYSHPLDQDRLDIGRTLEKLFLVKPELLDILDYEVVRTDVDSTGRRAKAVVRVRYKLLNESDGKVRESDAILYWIKRHPDCPISSVCAEGICRDAAGDTIARPTQKETDENEEEVPYACDATQADQWYMNLDSTLKEKPYQ